MWFYLIYSLFLFTIQAEITPPNYDFTIQSMEAFYPGKNIEEIKKLNPKFDLFADNGNQKTYRFKLKRTNYMLDVYTQVKENQITDLFVRLPQYFLHDILLKDLQNKWKKQDHFVRHDRSALYFWYNRDNTNIIYHGSCSITCFPMFLEIMTTDKTITPLYKKMNEALPNW